MRGRQLLRIKNRSSKWRVITDSFSAFFENDLTTSAAAISYYAMLMLFPLLLLLVSLGQTIFGGEVVRDVLVDGILTFLPGTRRFVSENVESLQAIAPGALVTCSLLVLWASTWIFTVIERAMNRIWATPSRPFLRGRLITTSMIGVVALLLGLSSLATSGIALIQASTQHLPQNFLPTSVMPLTTMAWQVAVAAASILITTLFFAILFKTMPNTEVSWIEVLPGALITAFFWEVLKQSFAFLLPRFLEEYQLFYGGAWLALVLLTWIYMSSIILLFGAQLTAVLHCRHDLSLAGDPIDLETPANVESADGTPC